MTAKTVDKMEAWMNEKPTTRSYGYYHRSLVSLPNMRFEVFLKQTSIENRTKDEFNAYGETLEEAFANCLHGLPDRTIVIETPPNKEPTV